MQRHMSMLTVQSKQRKQCCPSRIEGKKEDMFLFHMIFSRASSGLDSSNADNKENTLSRQKNSSDVSENLKKVQEDVTRLNASIGEMQAQFDRHFPPKPRD